MPLEPLADRTSVGLMLQRELAAHGRPTRLAGDHLVGDDGATYGLEPLTRACRRAPRHRWPEVVDHHVRRLLDSPVGPDLFDTLTLPDALAGVHLRLQARAAVPWPEGMRYARPVGSDVVEVLTYKRGEALAQLTDDVVERLGADELRQAGLVNLLASPMPTWQRRRLRGGAEVLCVRGDSGFTASRVLALPDLLRRTVGGGEDVALPHGALVCTPDRHTIGIHVVGHPELVSAFVWLGRLVAEVYPGAPYPLSPDVRWWVDGELRQVTDLTGVGWPPATAAFSRVVEQVAGCAIEEALRRYDEAERNRGRHKRRHPNRRSAPDRRRQAG